MQQAHPVPEGAFVECRNGQRIHYLEAGQGPTVVFLHGSGPGASGYSNFKGNYPEFARAGYHCLVLDLVGFGYSDKPEDKEYTLAFFVECVKQALDELGVERCSMVGNSLGGAVAIGLALAHTELVEGLILLAPGGLSAREEYLAMPAMQKMFAVYASEGGLNEAAMREMFEYGLVYDARHVSDELLAERMHIMGLMNAQVMATMAIPELAERLPELGCPVLVFWGCNDRMMPESGILALVRHCEDMKMIMLSECGHWVMVEHEALFNRECINFLTERTGMASAPAEAAL
jgi:4,5:9,10-diseco-3-hydroxy-5,9,17-trioxoandrosta-1(10),2-diene-4-oate hydrolase